MVVVVGLDSSCRMTFCSAAGNCCDRSLGLGSFHFLVTVVNPLSGPLRAATMVQEVGVGARPGGVGVGFP